MCTHASHAVQMTLTLTRNMAHAQGSKPAQTLILFFFLFASPIDMIRTHDI